MNKNVRPRRTGRRTAIGTRVILVAAVLIGRHTRRHPALAGLIGLVLVVSVATHLAVLILLAVAGAGGCVLFRSRRASTHGARRGPAPETPKRQGTKLLDARARRNGWLPPLSPELVLGGARAQS